MPEGVGCLLKLHSDIIVSFQPAPALPIRLTFSHFFSKGLFCLLERLCDREGSSVAVGDSGERKREHERDSVFIYRFTPLMATITKGPKHLDRH